MTGEGLDELGDDDALTGIERYVYDVSVDGIKDTRVGSRPHVGRHWQLEPQKGAWFDRAR